MVLQVTTCQVLSAAHVSIYVSICIIMYILYISFVYMFNILHICFQYLNIAPCTTKTSPRVLVTKVAF